MPRYCMSVICVSLCLCIGSAFAGDPVSSPATEHAKIEFLLRAVSESKLTFIRNGAQYDGARAADHLRTKWKAVGDKVASAAQFIDICAAKSSVTGEAYEIVLSDGTTRVPSAAWLGTVLFAHELTQSEAKAAPNVSATAPVPGSAETAAAAPKGPHPSAVDVLKYIEASDGIFLRPGGHRTDLSGRQFSAHLQGKAVLAGFSLTGSARDFIANIASDSSLHGTAYSVKFPDGTEMEVKAWLTQVFRPGPATRPDAV